MTRQLRNPSFLAAALIAFLSASSHAQVFAAQPAFRGFGVPNAYIQDMTPDGGIVVGIFVDGPQSGTAFRWTAAGGLEELGGLMDTVHISRDGTTIVGAALDSQGIQSAAIWLGGKNWRTLGGVPGGVTGNAGAGGQRLSHALGVSGDGTVIVGSAGVANSQVHGFRWDATAGMVDLGSLIADESSVAGGISADGKAIIGWTRDPGVASHVGDGRVGIVNSNGVARTIHPYGWAGEARGSNDVGSIIVGVTHPANTKRERGGATTWKWSAWDGSLQDLGAIWQGVPGINIVEYQSKPWGVSDTGEVVVGQSGAFHLLPYIWTTATGMVTIGDYLTAGGVTSHQGWDLRVAGYVSPNGKIIAGTGFNPQRIAESWIVTIP